MFIHRILNNFQTHWDLSEGDLIFVDISTEGLLMSTMSPVRSLNQDWHSSSFSRQKYVLWQISPGTAAESMSQRERWKLEIISSPTFGDLFYKKLLLKTETLAIKTHLVRESGHQAKVYHKIALEMSKRCEILTISQKRWPGLLPISQKLIFTKFHNFHRDLKVSCWSGVFYYYFFRHLAAVFKKALQFQEVYCMIYKISNNHWISHSDVFHHNSFNYQSSPTSNLKESEMYFHQTNCYGF